MAFNLGTTNNLKELKIGKRSTAMITAGENIGSGETNRSLSLRNCIHRIVDTKPKSQQPPSPKNIFFKTKLNYRNPKQEPASEKAIRARTGC